MSDMKNVIAINASEILISTSPNEAYQIKIDDTFLADDSKALAWVQINMLSNLASLIERMLAALAHASSPESARAAASAVSEETIRAAMRAAQEAMKTWGGTIPTVR